MVSAKPCCETCETSETALISMLQQKLDRKDAHLSAKDEQIRALNTSLSECSAALLAAQETARVAQVLDASTMQQLADGSADCMVDGKSEKATEVKNRRWFTRWFGK
jgi:hypothetical protein